MSYQLDHVVHAVSHPEQAAAQMSQIGVHTVGGGRHSHGGTYNSLAYFGLSYIEWLGIYDMAAAQLPTENALPRQVLDTLVQGPGFMRAALRTTNLDETITRLQAADIPLAGPVRLGRVRPDGQEIAWTLLFPESEPGKLLYPFFIQWDEADEARMADLRANGSIAAHPIGSLRIVEICFAVHNLQDTVGRWEVLLDEATVRTENVPSYGAVKTSFHLEGVDLGFYAPASDGYLQHILAERGEHPFCVRLAGAVPSDLNVKVAGGRYQIDADAPALG